jgi:DNA-binding response OmpR family regulator
MIKILLVEDEPDLLDLTAYVLRRERFVVVEAADGTQALRRWKVDRPDLVILDLGLPGVEGFEVLRQIRAESETPVLVVTGRKDMRDILRAFNLGTDDFIAKPFEFKVLIAHIRAILRRAKLIAQEVRESRVDLNGMSLDPETYEVQWRDSYCRLTPTEFRILYLLATNAGRVVSASRIYTYVWGSDGGDANALRSHISHMRHKLEVGGVSPGTIASVPAVGYVFRPAPAAAAPAAARPATPTVVPVGPMSTSSAPVSNVASEARQQVAPTT